MGIHDAKAYIGKTCSVRWLDRTGTPVDTVSRVHDVAFMPLYGGYLVVDSQDIRLDRVVDVLVIEEDGAEAPARSRARELPLAA